jgi:hypothetical protein
MNLHKNFLLIVWNIPEIKTGRGMFFYIIFTFTHSALKGIKLIT